MSATDCLEIKLVQECTYCGKVSDNGVDYHRASEKERLEIREGNISVVPGNCGCRYKENGLIGKVGSVDL